MFRLWRGCVCVNPLFLWALLSSRKIVLNREEHNSKGMDGRNARKWMKSTKKRQPLMKTRTPWGNKNKDQRENNPSTAINFIVLTPRRQAVYKVLPVFGTNWRLEPPGKLQNRHSRWTAFRRQSYCVRHTPHQQHNAHHKEAHSPIADKPAGCPPIRSKNAATSCSTSTSTAARSAALGSKAHATSRITKHVQSLQSRYWMNMSGRPHQRCLSFNS